MAIVPRKPGKPEGQREDLPASVCPAPARRQLCGGSVGRAWGWCWERPSVCLFLSSVGCFGLVYLPNGQHFGIIMFPLWKSVLTGISWFV